MPIFNHRLNRQKSQSSVNLFRKRDNSQNSTTRFNNSKYPRELLRKYRLCLKYVPKDVSAENIELLCSKYGKVLDVTYSSKTPHKFVSFSSLSEMEKALEGLKDNQYGIVADIAKDRNVQEDDTMSIAESLLDRIRDDDLFENLISDFKYTRNTESNSNNRSFNEKKQTQKETPSNVKESKENPSNRKNNTSSNSKSTAQQGNSKSKQNEDKNSSDINKKNVDDNNIGEFNYTMINDDKSVTGYCILCSKIGDKACGRCGDCYCSLQCQKIDWKRHRYFCLPMPHLVPLAHVADYYTSINVQNHKVLNNDSSILQISSSNQQVQQQQQQIHQKQVQQQIPMKTGPPRQQQNAYGNMMQQGGPYSINPYNRNNNVNDPKIANTNNNNKQQQQQQKPLTNNALTNDKSPKKDVSENQIASMNSAHDKKNTQTTTNNELKPKEIEQQSLNEAKSQEPSPPSSSSTSSSNDQQQKLQKEQVVKETTKPMSTQNENENEKAKNEFNPLQDTAIASAQFPSTGSHVQITAVIKPDLLYVRSLDTESNVQYVKAINMVNNESRKSKLLDKIPNKGDLVSAKFEDIGYYRALVLNPINKNRIIVAFIDNGEITEKCLSEMKELSNEAKLFKRYVFPIKLKNIPSNIDNKSSLNEIMDYLNSYIDCCDKELKITYEKKDTTEQEPSDIDAELIEITSNENLNNHILKLLNK